MEAPEKIYLPSILVANTVRYKEEGFIEYVRADAFIEKAREWSNDEVKIGETQIYIEDDGGEPPYDGKQWLDLGCLEYEIPKDKFKDGDNVEVILRKIRKGG